MSSRASVVVASWYWCGFLRRDSKAVMLWIANPARPVRLRLAPPFLPYALSGWVKNTRYSPGGEIGRHRGLKIPRSLRACRFKSGPGHHIQYSNRFKSIQIDSKYLSSPRMRWVSGAFCVLSRFKCDLISTAILLLHLLLLRFNLGR